MDGIWLDINALDGNGGGNPSSGRLKIHVPGLCIDHCDNYLKC